MVLEYHSFNFDLFPLVLGLYKGGEIYWFMVLSVFRQKKNGYGCIEP